MWEFLVCFVLRNWAKMGPSVKLLSLKINRGSSMGAFQGAEKLFFGGIVWEMFGILTGLLFISRLWDGGIINGLLLRVRLWDLG